MTDKNLISSFDKIKLTNEQKKHILQGVLSHKRREKIHFTKYFSVVSSCVAAILIAIGIYSYNGIISDKTTFIYNDFSLYHQQAEKSSMEYDFHTPAFNGARGITIEEKAKNDSRKEFFDKIGFDFTQNIILPEDFKEDVDEECDFSIDKDVDFVFSGKDERNITVTLSHNLNKFDLYLNDKSIKQTNIYDNAIITFSDDDVYGGFFIKDGVLYRIVSNNISQKEFEIAIISVIK